MKKAKLHSRRAHWFVGAVLAAGAGAGPATAGSYSILHQFTGGADGALLESGVAVDGQGEMYGTTYRGGALTGPNGDNGTIFKSDPAGNVTTLHDFNNTDGANAIEPLTLVGHALYGTTQFGGLGAYGVAFSINTDGSFFTVLHNFSGLDGYNPIGPLAHVPGRGVVGLTVYGGPGFVSPAQPGRGVLFALTRDGKFGKLHDFEVASGDFPNTVITNATGTIFGSTSSGGGCAKPGGCGVIFQYDLTTQTYTVIYSFTGGADGIGPQLGSIGPDGTLYGTASAVTGAPSGGTLFKLAPVAGVYQLTTLATFTHATGFPTSGPTLAPDGSLVGVSSKSLYAYQNGALTILHDFGPYKTGYEPFGQPTITKRGIILGTTYQGGIAPCAALDGSYINASGCGLLYHYVPNQ